MQAARTAILGDVLVEVVGGDVAEQLAGFARSGMITLPASLLSNRFIGVVRNVMSLGRSLRSDQASERMSPLLRSSSTVRLPVTACSEFLNLIGLVIVPREAAASIARMKFCWR